MKRIVLYAIVAVAVLVPGVLLAGMLVETDQDKLDAIVSGLERGGLDSMLDNAAFDQGGLLVSAGRQARHFDASGRAEARELLSELTGLGDAGRVRVRQRQVTVREGTATAVVNVEVGEGSFVALTLGLVSDEGRWLVDRVRVMS